MKHFLVVVDMQKDFVDGSLGSSEAQSIVSSAAEKIRNAANDTMITAVSISGSMNPFSSIIQNLYSQP